MSDIRFVAVVLCNDINGLFWTRTRVLTGEETIAEIYDWRRQIDAWQRGDLRIVAAEEASRDDS